MRLHGVFEQFPVGFHVILVRTRLGIYFRRQVPVALDLGLTLLWKFQSVTWHEFANTGKHRLLASDVTKSEILRQHAPIEFGIDAGVRENCFDLRPEKKSLAVPAV